MSDREAFKELISEAIFGWGLRNDDGYSLSMDDTDEIAEYIMEQAAQAQAQVNQQLLDGMVNLLIAAKGAIKLGRDLDATNYISAAIAAAQEAADRRRGSDGDTETG